MGWCYKHYIDKTKPKGIIKRIIYYIWLSVGVSPSGIIEYELDNKYKYSIVTGEKSLKEFLLKE